MQENSDDNKEVRIDPSKPGKVSDGEKSGDETVDAINEVIKKRIKDDYEKKMNAE